MHGEAGIRCGRDTVVVVTGASAGVGRALVRMLGERGARVGLIGREPGRLGSAAREVEAAGGRALAIPADVADPDAVEAAAGEVERVLGPIDVWVNNASVTVYSPIARMTAEEYGRVTDVTYLGAVHGTLSALRRMGPRNRGVIVQVSSGLAYRSFPLQSAYCAAKWALRGFSASLRTELIHDRSRVAVSVVHLPALNTPQFGWSRTRMDRRSQPAPPVFQPEIAAAAILWAAEHAPRDLALGPPTQLAAIGEFIAPELMDQYVAGTAWDAQLDDDPVDPAQPENLFEPAPGDPGAHGAFDDRARQWSPHLWIETHRWIYSAIAAFVGACGAALLARRSTSRTR
jgi:NAD(P)-dependent dehydrogenase (short-subunit alcohol dehydrogenase family)